MTAYTTVYSNPDPKYIEEKFSEQLSTCVDWMIAMIIAFSRRELLDSLLTTLRDKRISLAILFSIIAFFTLGKNRKQFLLFYIKVVLKSHLNSK